jgi:hypothetical protein
MGSWVPASETAAFRDALIAGGPTFPASVVFLNSAHGNVAERFDSQGRHRVIHGNMRLRDLRLLVCDLIGLPATELTRKRRSQRNGRTISHSDEHVAGNGQSQGSSADVEAGLPRNGASP